MGTDITSTRSLAPLGAGPAGDADRTKVRALAEQFEAMLISQMLDEMKRAMTPEGEGPGLGAQLMGDTVTTELAQALGRAGGLGLSEMLGTALSRLEGTASNQPAGPAAPSYLPVASPAAAASIQATVATAPPVAAPGTTRVDGPGAASGSAVTSAYGWRSDPLDGRHRFHAGLDLRAAYGQEVRAATDGVVTFAGEQSGYGLVVKVSHANGLETRYAHLSSATVSVGDQVGAGDVIARSGSSGRATGPHLHFEVRQDGRPVHPDQVTGLTPVVGPAETAAGTARTAERAAMDSGAGGD